MSYEKRVKIVLHGHLKDLYPEEIYMSGHSVSEVINGMCKATDAFNPRPGTGRHAISVVGFNTVESLTEPLPADTEELHLVPTMAGGKKGGFFQIVLGVVMIAAAIYLGPGVTAFGGAFQVGGVGGFLFSSGLSMVLGGLMAFLSPTPKADSYSNDVADPEASKYLGASQNTVKIGTRIPIPYGRNKLFGHYLSFDVDAKDVAIT